MKMVALGVAALALVGCDAAPAEQPSARPAAANARGPARGVAEPVAFVRSAYARYAADQDVPVPREAYSARLAALIEADEGEANGEVGRLGFDPWINGQDWTLSNIEVSSEPNGETRHTVVARFRNSGIPNVNRFHFVLVGDRWALDDIENAGTPDQPPWRLTEILSQPLRP